MGYGYKVRVGLGVELSRSEIRPLHTPVKAVFESGSPIVN